ncbi:hypothetical protein QQP08_020329 [Theobroma cacao]|uniref:To encode a PR protein, Belongs to the plant thionin family with the following members:, putative n=1 Tax=Theobroma cacao TaxID=3641 RepID=A0A061GH02_THECC|nr:To encode a PR protein, Belongs to the plant thionin family with the following members:, putative [Theobroma cacao]WRX27842.1 hypothetical protein QQP08_020329 [Theobroma cacao]
MEGRGVGSVLMVYLVLGLLVGQSTASFQTCYMGCFIWCVITPNNTVFSCSVKCLKDCIIPSFSFPSGKDTQYFCKLGCATSLCTDLSSKENPGEEKVGSCVDSCSETCAKN